MHRRSQPACELEALKGKQDIFKFETDEPEIKAEALDVLSEPLLKIKAEALDVLSEPLLKRKAEAVDVFTVSSDQSMAASPFLNRLRPTSQECQVCCWSHLPQGNCRVALTSKVALACS